jgi:hypothetical protein
VSDDVAVFEEADEAFYVAIGKDFSDKLLYIQSGGVLEGGGGSSGGLGGQRIQWGFGGWRVQWGFGGPADRGSRGMG